MNVCGFHNRWKTMIAIWYCHRNIIIRTLFFLRFVSMVHQGVRFRKKWNFVVQGQRFLVLVIYMCVCVCWPNTFIYILSPSLYRVTRIILYYNKLDFKIEWKNTWNIFDIKHVYTDSRQLEILDFLNTKNSSLNRHST